MKSKVQKGKHHSMSQVEGQAKKSTFALKATGKQGKTELRVDSFIESEDEQSILSSVQEKESLNASSYNMPDSSIANSSVAKSEGEFTYYVEDTSIEEETSSDDDDSDSNEGGSDYSLASSYDEEVAE